MLPLVALISVAAVSVSALPSPQGLNSSVTQPATTATITNACAQVSQATASFLAGSPTATPSIAATLAYQCLQSVPNKPDPAQKLITSLKAFVGWQSTLAWLKAPPPSYMLPAVDILGGLDNISTTAVAGKFASEYDFQLSIVELISAAHDGHFAYRPDVFKVFIFRNNLVADLVSVSRDGKEKPKLYHYADLEGNSTFPSGNGTLPRAITKINGRDAATVLELLNLKYSGFQDPDSQWNSQFQRYASPDALPIIAASLFFQGTSITLTYDNGQERTENSIATVRPTVDFAGVNSGGDFYDRFCTPDPLPAAAVPAVDADHPTATAPSTSTALTAPAPTISGYPFPVIRDNGGNVTAGYFLNGTGYGDVAVLSVAGFSPEGPLDAITYLSNFQDTVEKFLAQCKAQSKKRLVVDVTANGGGFVVAGYDLFAQLFPNVPPFQADNIRLSDSVQDMAKMVDSLPEDIAQNATQEQLSAIMTLGESSVVSNLVPGGVFAPNGAQLNTVEEIFTPVPLNGDRFTAYQQTPLNETSSSFNLTGTGNRSNPPPAVFRPEDVLLLTDGTCGSTCTLFAYLMIMQLNVLTVAVGGRPTTGAMQSVAGVEGAQVFPMLDIGAAAAAVQALGPTGVKAGSELALIAEGYALSRAASPVNPGSVNGKNAFSSHNSQIPLQFLYQAANCRFFYTADMIYGPEAVWKRAVDATWTDPAQFCVEGSRVPINNTLMVVDPVFRQATGAAIRVFSARTVNLSVVVPVLVALALLIS